MAPTPTDPPAAPAPTAATTSGGFHESHLKRPLRDLNLTLSGTPLAGVIAAFEKELAGRGLTRVRPRFYLSTEWGVPWGTVAIAIPFYLASVDLTTLHADRAGFVEGADAADVQRDFRHEMGHVFNYAYQLYERPEWRQHFGDIAQEYVEEYHPRPFSREHVWHLPGWYAQKHPDEDWAETFAVWMTPGVDWRAAYAAWPTALAKLEYCDRVMAEVRAREPLVTNDELDEDVSELTLSLEDYYGAGDADAGESPFDADGALDALFPAGVTSVAAATAATTGATEAGARGAAGGEPTPLPAAEVIRRASASLPTEVYRWTGHFPERSRALLRRLAARAEQRGSVCPAGRELQATVALTAFVTALAMDRVLAACPLPAAVKKEK